MSNFAVREHIEKDPTQGSFLLWSIVPVASPDLLLCNPATLQSSWFNLCPPVFPLSKGARTILPEQLPETRFPKVSFLLFSNFKLVNNLTFIPAPLGSVSDPRRLTNDKSGRDGNDTGKKKWMCQIPSLDVSKFVSPSLSLNWKRLYSWKGWPEKLL